ncbi:MAG TPA: binary toxin-like calcium binding domain-containing protein, partial [Woeseiaceae bacterium]
MSFGLALSAVTVDAATIDSDRDGLSDELEISLGFDPHSVDSNMDGIADLDAYRSMSRNSLVSRQDAAAGPTGDVDGDGIRDFLETYGYYDQDHALVGLRRIVPEASWNEFAARPSPVQEGPAVYQLAAAALKSTLLAQYSAIDHAYIVDVAAAYPVIRNAFINGGVPADSALINGSTAQAGSIAAIMSFLVTQHDYLVPTDSSGKARPIYFTHPLRASTDDDPYTDYEEALGIFNAGRPAAPADHPLVAALPSIRARLASYRLTEISESSTTLGTSETHTDVVRNTVSVGQSNGFAVGITAELEFGPTSNSTKYGVTVTQSNSWSSGTSVTTEDRNAHGTFSQRTDSASNNCFAKLGLTVQLENVGSALASNISTSLNVFLGDTLWRTVPVTTATSGLTLQPHGSRTVTVLGQGTEESCLTLHETNYLEQGGLIGIETALGDATISIYDPAKQLVVQDGSWAVYKALIENELARIDLNVTTTAG